MLSEHERRQLAQIERHFCDTDPALVRRLTGNNVTWPGVALALGALGLGSGIVLNVVLLAAASLVPLLYGLFTLFPVPTASPSS